MVGVVAVLLVGRMCIFSFQGKKAHVTIESSVLFALARSREIISSSPDFLTCLQAWCPCARGVLRQKYTVHCSVYYMSTTKLNILSSKLPYILLRLCYNVVFVDLCANVLV